MFAELFNEMLMRDFGFNIYKEMYLHSQTVDNSKEENKEDAAAAASKDETTNASNEEDKTNKDKEQHANNEDDNQSAKSSNNAVERKRRASHRDGKDSKDKDEKDREHRKMVVAKPYLLLSFIYFDNAHCGFIFERDLEELFLILGLSLSRGQLKKVLGKTRQAFYYRLV